MKKIKLLLLLVLGICALVLVPSVNATDTTTITTTNTLIQENSELALFLEDKFGSALTNIVSVIIGGLILFFTLISSVKKYKKIIKSILDNTIGTVEDIKSKGTITQEHLDAITQQASSAIELYKESKKELEEQADKFIAYKDEVEKQMSSLKNESNALIQIINILVSNNTSMIKNGVADSIKKVIDELNETE